MSAAGTDCCECCAAGHPCAGKPRRDAFGQKIKTAQAAAMPRTRGVGELSAWIATRKVSCSAWLNWSEVQRAKWLEQQNNPFGVIAAEITRDCIAAQGWRPVSRIVTARAAVVNDGTRVPGLLRSADEGVNRPKRRGFGVIKSARDASLPDVTEGMPHGWGWDTDADGNPIPVTADGTPIPLPPGATSWGHVQDPNTGQSVPIPIDSTGLPPGSIGYDANGTPTTVARSVGGQAQADDGTFLYPNPPAITANQEVQPEDAQLARDNAAAGISLGTTSDGTPYYLIDANGNHLDAQGRAIAGATGGRVGGENPYEGDLNAYHELTPDGHMIIGARPGQFAYYPGTHDVVMVSRLNDQGEPVDADGTVLTTEYTRADGTTVASAGHTASGGLTTAQEIAIGMGLVNAGLGFARGFLSDQQRHDTAHANASMSSIVAQKRMSPTGQPIEQHFNPPANTPPAAASTSSTTQTALVVGGTVVGLGVLVGGAIALAKVL